MHGTTRKHTQHHHCPEERGGRSLVGLINRYVVCIVERQTHAGPLSHSVLLNDHHFRNGERTPIG